MTTLQRRIAATAIFDDEVGFETDPIPFGTDVRAETASPPADPEPPVVVGVDQSFLEDRAISAIVAMRGGEVVERVHAITPLSIPYIPGLLAFREGEPILAAFAELSVEPDVVLFDGSGRIHFRQAGIATHVGVVLDLPSVGVAKRLLCGQLRDPPAEPFPAGTRVPIVANGRVDAPDGTLLGYAVQSKQYDSGTRYINPLYVSPGHRLCAETAADLALACCTDYKLPEPIRLADRYAAELKREIS